MANWSTLDRQLVKVRTILQHCKHMVWPKFFRIFKNSQNFLKFSEFSKILRISRGRLAATRGNGTLHTVD